jgi:hypothetical protein
MTEPIQMIRDLTARLAAVAEEFSRRAEATTPSHGESIQPAEVDQAKRIDQVKVLIETRRLRGSFFSNELFHEPAWDMLLSLYLSWHKGETLFVKSLVATAAAPVTTSQRWIDHLAKLGLVTRVVDPIDRRRITITLSQSGLQAIDDYLSALAASSAT